MRPACVACVNARLSLTYNSCGARLSKSDQERAAYWVEMAGMQLRHGRKQRATGILKSAKLLLPNSKEIQAAYETVKFGAPSQHKTEL